MVAKASASSLQQMDLNSINTINIIFVNVTQNITTIIIFPELSLFLNIYGLNLYDLRKAYYETIYEIICR